MEDQLTLMNEMDRKLRIGEEITGDVLSIAGDEIFVSLIGYKSDAVIPVKELCAADKLTEALETIKVGSPIKAKVIKLKNEDGYVVLSRLEYEKEKALSILQEKFNNREILSLNIKSASENGLVGYYDGVRIFVPISQIDLRFVKNPSDFIGKDLDVVLIDFLANNTLKIVASRRILLEEALSKKEDAVYDTLNVGDIITVEVKRFTKFGAFAEYNGVDGLIHLSQLSWKHVKDAAEVLTIGEKVDAKVITLDKETKKLSLSIKQLSPEPWSIVEEKYPVGSAVLGKVVRINDFGAFVELEPGLDGLVHISKLSHNHVKHPSEVVTVNEEVKCIILDVNKENKKLSLSIKDAE